MAQAPQHRDRLVQTAMRLFRRQGFASTGLQQILKESGAPKGSLYHYFPEGKEALGAAAVDLAGELIGEMLADLKNKHGEDAGLFVQQYAATMAGWMAESEFSSGCPIATTMLEMSPQSPSITRAGQRAFERWIEIIASVFVAAGVPDNTARERGQALVAGMEGALLLARVQGSAQPILDVANHFRIAR